MSGAIRRSHESKKRMWLATVNALEGQINTGDLRRPEFARSLDTGRLMGVAIVQPLEHLAQLAYHCQIGFYNHVVIVRHGLMR